MHYIEESEFRRPSRKSIGPHDSLVVHSRDQYKCTNLVIFAHGLHGHRYKTWGSFPEFLYDDLDGVDVGMYSYSSGIKRLAKLDVTALGAHAQELSDNIRDSHYKNVVLVGHSMGGLLCKATVKDMLDSQATTKDGGPVSSKIAGLILMGTPQAGSTVVPRILSMLNAEARILKAHSDFVAALNNTFSDRISTDPRVAAGGKLVLPTYAVLGTGDKWVDALSAGMNIPRDYKKTVRGTHGSIVKPRNKNDDAYRWFREAVSWCIQRNRNPAATPLQISQTQSAMPAGAAGSLEINGVAIYLSGDMLSRPLRIDISPSSDVTINMELPRGGGDEPEE